MSYLLAVAALCFGGSRGWEKEVCQKRVLLCLKEKKPPYLESEVRDCYLKETK